MVLPCYLGRCRAGGRPPWPALQSAVDHWEEKKSTFINIVYKMYYSVGSISIVLKTFI